MDYFDIDLELTEKDLALKEAAHRFAKEVMRPVAKELDGMSAEDYIADSSPFNDFTIPSSSLQKFTSTFTAVLLRTHFAVRSMK